MTTTEFSYEKLDNLHIEITKKSDIMLEKIPSKITKNLFDETLSSRDKGFHLSGHKASVTQNFICTHKL